uniref:hypothetical protein n=1 Tax=Proteus vulgaris TaxID=585 RepID=UPI00195476ED
VDYLVDDHVDDLAFLLEAPAQRRSRRQTTHSDTAHPVTRERFEHQPPHSGTVIVTALGTILNVSHRVGGALG